MYFMEFCKDAHVLMPDISGYIGERVFIGRLMWPAITSHAHVWGFHGNIAWGFGLVQNLTVDWTVDWTLDWILDLIFDLSVCVFVAKMESFQAEF